MLKKFSTFYNGEIAICDVKDANHILDNVISVTSMAVTRGMKFINYFIGFCIIAFRTILCIKNTQ